jgi:hypothetical protein
MWEPARIGPDLFLFFLFPAAPSFAIVEILWKDKPQQLNLLERWPSG